MAKSHQDLKHEALKKKNSKIITDSDYVLRDIGTEEDRQKNIIDITPEEYKKKPEPKAKAAPKEE